MNLCGHTSRMFLFSLLLSGPICVLPVAAAELVMIEQAGCVYCEKFNREIAGAYPHTEEGKKAPLRRVDLHDEWPADLSRIKIQRFTPTFILVENNREYARLNGYPGDNYFWFLLGEMLEKLDAEKARSKGAGLD